MHSFSILGFVYMPVCRLEYRYKMYPYRKKKSQMCVHLELMEIHIFTNRTWERNHTFLTGGIAYQEKFAVDVIF